MTAAASSRSKQSWSRELTSGEARKEGRSRTRCVGLAERGAQTPKVEDTFFCMITKPMAMTKPMATTMATAVHM